MVAIRVFDSRNLEALTGCQESVDFIFFSTIQLVI